MNVVVTGGGTLAPIDDVRTIANISSGRFSAMITEACLDRGATVWHLHAPNAQLPFFRQAGLDLLAPFDQEAARLERLARAYRAKQDRLRLVPLPTGTVAEYERLLRGIFTVRPIDVVFLAMAVSDFEPDRVPGKIDSGDDDLVLRCRPAPKVIRSVRDWAPSVFLVGFKLLSGVTDDHLIAEAREACRINRADLTIANDLKSVQAGQHRVQLVQAAGQVQAMGPAPDLAEQVVERVFDLARSAMAGREPIPLSPDE